MKKNICFFIVLLVMASCGKQEKSSVSAAEETMKVKIPQFIADSAYSFVKKQVSFGPRVPNTKAHQMCGDYLVAELTRFGIQVTEQKADVKAYNNTILHSRNIIGSINPNSKNRVLLCAHWDCRPYSDNDKDSKNYLTPVQGANDGASGVAVLLELARLMQKDSVKIGVDIIFLDAEDYGRPQFDSTSTQEDDSYCLGTQYWAKNPHKQGYKAKYGILLDMVGGKNPTFLKESFSESYAADVVEKVWQTANDLGYGNYFVNTQGSPIIDDHYYINKLAGIPCIDIIHYDNQLGFPPTWHTINDTMENIDKNTLKVVGDVITTIVYQEK